MTIQSEVGAIFGRRVREVRSRLQWSQAELARRLEELGRPMSQAVIARIEAKDPGTRALKVSLDDVLAIAAVLGVSPLFLFLPLEDDAIVTLASKLELPASTVRAWVTGAQPLRDGDDRRIFETERDERSAALIAAARLTQEKMQLARHNARRRSADRKRRAEELAEMFLHESEREIGELQRRGVAVDQLKRNLVALTERRLARLREMSLADWELEEEREAEYYLDAIEEEEER
jgi:transcriptional regulator with XRE-family HTH domain